MSWLQFTTCKHALPTCRISNPLAITQLCIKAVCLFCSPFPHFVPRLACIPPRITTFSVFQFQLLPLERGLMNVAHIRVTSEITPPFFPKKIHQAESASPRDVWFSTQGECLSHRPQMARYWWGVRRTEMSRFWKSYSLQISCAFITHCINTWISKLCQSIFYINKETNPKRKKPTENYHLTVQFPPALNGV